MSRVKFYSHKLERAGGILSDALNEDLRVGTITEGFGISDWIVRGNLAGNWLDDG